MNHYIDVFNTTILDRLPGVSDTYYMPSMIPISALLFLVIYYSADLVQENDPNDSDSFDSMKTSNFLSFLTHPGVPPHELHKIGAVCTIMRKQCLWKKDR